jgi:rhodanese-related sulfurtransferase
MSLPAISPQDAKLLLEKGALLIDIRDADEHGREHIPNGKNVPISKLCDTQVGDDHDAIVYYCRSGNRTKMNAPLLMKAAKTEAFILEGGIENWKKAGMAVNKQAGAPIEMMRQVQIVAGSLVVLGAALGYLFNPAFYALSGVVGAGLMFSGISGTCAMARILNIMPWNKAAA